MASKTQVSGNRVTIDEYAYDVKPAGQNRYTVVDEFGGTLGHFMLRGKTIVPDDYGVSGAHPVLQIAKLWMAANTPSDEKSGPASPVVCRIAVLERPAAGELEQAKAYQAWLKKLPGLKAAHFAYDAATGKAVSISVWENRERMAALRERTPPDGAVALKTLSVEVLPVVDD
jgi:heme-degrading monooxygenase HmoA